MACRNAGQVCSWRRWRTSAIGWAAKLAGRPRSIAIRRQGRVEPTLASIIAAAARPRWSPSVTQGVSAPDHSCCGMNANGTDPDGVSARVAETADEPALVAWMERDGVG